MNRGLSPALVVFRLEDRRYALPLKSVARIVRMVEISPLPKAPPIVLGIIDVAGEIVPIFDIRRRFGLPVREADPNDQIILARTTVGTAGLIVDETLGVMDTDAGSVTPPQQVVPGLEFVAGIFRREDGLILIHDLDTFLSVTEAAALDLALPSPALR